MKNAAALALSLSVMSGSLTAQEPTITTLLTKDVVGAAGKEILVITVENAPGASDPEHRHNAQAVVYVLEGSVVMQVEGKPAVTLGVGGTFYESPEDVHLVARNASTSATAKFLVFFVKGKGAAFKADTK